MTSTRPVCLWDRAHTVEPTIDNWGRCADFARTSDKTLHLASKEQYHVESSTEVASQVMDDFFKVNWPSIHEQQKVYKAPQNLNAAEGDRPRTSYKHWQKNYVTRRREFVEMD
jgi:hypothetical protein